MGVRKGVLNKQIVAADPEDNKSSVRLVTTVALPAYSRTANVITASADGALPAIDGTAPVQGDSILLKDGASAVDNGIYVVTQLGDGSNPFILTRRGDSDTTQFVNSGMRCGIEEGLQFGGKGTEFVLVTPNPITLNTTPLDFQEVETGGGGIFAEVNDPDVIDIAEGTRSPILGSLSGDGAVGGEGILTQVNIDDNYTQFDVPLRNEKRVPAGQQMLYKGIPKWDGILIADGIVTEARESADELLETLGEVLDLDEILIGGGSPAVPVGPAEARARLDVPSTAEVDAVAASVGPIGQLQLSLDATPDPFPAEVGKLHLPVGGITTYRLPDTTATVLGDVLGFWFSGSIAASPITVESHDGIALQIDDITGTSVSSILLPAVRSLYLFKSGGPGSTWLPCSEPYSQLAAAQADKLLGTGSGGEPAVFDQADFLTLPIDAVLKSSNFNAVANTIHRWNGSATVTMTLPTSPPDGTQVGVFDSATSGTPSNVLTILRGGSDTIDSMSGKAVASLIFRGQGTFVLLTYDASSGRWKVHAGGGVQSLLTGGTDRLAASDTSGRPLPVILNSASVLGKLTGNVQALQVYNVEHILREDGTTIPFYGLSGNEAAFNAGNATNFRRAWWVGINPDAGSFHLIQGIDSSQTTDDAVLEKHFVNLTTTESFYVSHQDPAAGAGEAIRTPRGMTYEVGPLEQLRLVRDLGNNVWRLDARASENHLPLDDGTAGVLTQGMPCYMSAGTVLQTDASSAATAKFIGLQDDPRTAIASMRIAVSGPVRVPAARQTGTWTAGDRLYADPATPGKITNAVPTGTGDFVIPIGTSLNTPGGGEARVLIEKGPIVEIT